MKNEAIATLLKNGLSASEKDIVKRETGNYNIFENEDTTLKYKILSEYKILETSIKYNLKDLKQEQTDLEGVISDYKAIKERYNKTMPLILESLNNGTIKDIKTEYFLGTNFNLTEYKLKDLELRIATNKFLNKDNLLAIDGIGGNIKENLYEHLNIKTKEELISYIDYINTNKEQTLEKFLTGNGVNLEDVKNYQKMERYDHYQVLDNAARVEIENISKVLNDDNFDNWVNENYNGNFVDVLEQIEITRDKDNNITDAKKKDGLSFDDNDNDKEIEK